MESFGEMLPHFNQDCNQWAEKSHYHIKVGSESGEPLRIFSTLTLSLSFSLISSLPIETAIYCSLCVPEIEMDCEEENFGTPHDLDRYMHIRENRSRKSMVREDLFWGTHLQVRPLGSLTWSLIQTWML